ncbi:hypothetical protein QUB68_28225 [Microcoleus sp. A006_D1]|uniref:hypothetical protein n=1 Tax=Microcoleus sp. A006_D1 TaxID=3055267 RepID=UPI002FCECEBB
MKISFVVCDRTCHLCISRDRSRDIRVNESCSALPVSPVTLSLGEVNGVWVGNGDVCCDRTRHLCISRDTCWNLRLRNSIQVS